MKNQDVPRWVVKLATVLELRVGRVIFFVICSWDMNGDLMIYPLVN